MKKQILAGILSATMVVGMGGVSVFAADKADDKTYNIGICQLVQHEALDAATQGFKDAISRTLRVIPIHVLQSSPTLFLKTLI